MKSNLQIFKTELYKSKNALIENIDTYLATCEMTYANANFQYQKIALSTVFKVNVEQADFQVKTLGNFAKLIQDEKTYYYFITNFTWLSENCCALLAELDTVNTFNNELEWSDKTTIQREHRDRFINSGNLYLNITKSYAVLDTTTTTITLTYQSDDLINSTIKALKSVLITQDKGNIKFGTISYTLDNKTGTLTIVRNIVPLTVPAKGTIYYNITYIRPMRHIDRISEGITPVLFGRNEGKILDSSDASSWYVIYNTQNGDNSSIVETLMCKDEGIYVNKATEDIISTDIEASDLVDGYYYFIDSIPSVVAKQQGIEEGRTDYYRIQEYSGSKTTSQCFVYYKDGTTIHLNLYSYIETIDFDALSSTTELSITSLGHYPSINLSSYSTFYIYKSTENYQDYDGRNKFKECPKENAGSDLIKTYISSIDDLTKTEKTLIKIIKFPYCPINYTIDDDNTYTFENRVQSIDSLGGTFLLLNPNAQFGKTLSTDITNPMYAATEYLTSFISTNNTRNDDNESKLYHSDYYQPKIVYDSFAKVFQLENIVNSIPQTEEFVVKYKPSKNFNSNFMFTFENYITDSRETEDYNNILIVSRNNELPIYNSDYLNYIKNGYNYDVKARKQQNTMNWLGTGLSTAGAIAGAMFAPTTGGASLAVAGLAMSAVSSISKNISSSISADRNMEQKINSLKNQSMSVSNADDIDLLQEYSGNKAKLMIYKISEETKASIADLFYYCGYKTARQGKPDLQSRYWFNFIQCEPVFVNTNLYTDFLENIEQRYAEGVTVYHQHEDEAGMPVYDLEQKKENYESFLF